MGPGLSREQIRNLYIRVCRDSGFQLDYARAAQLAAKVGGFHPMDVWTALPSLSTMRAIAAGDHPACQQEPRP